MSLLPKESVHRYLIRPAESGAEIAAGSYARPCRCSFPASNRMRRYTRGGTRRDLSVRTPKAAAWETQRSYGLTVLQRKGNYSTRGIILQSAATSRSCGTQVKYLDCTTTVLQYYSKLEWRHKMEDPSEFRQWKQQDLTEATRDRTHR
jgi:hypothetical protein